jgi:hypothetical protein
MPEIICLNCGNPRKCSPSEALRIKFCCRSCQREYDQKRKEYCPDCLAEGEKVKLTSENTYNRGYSPEGKAWLDNVCKKHRIKRNNAAYQKRKAAAGNVQAPHPGKATAGAKHICGPDGYERGTEKTWVKRMLSSPVIFSDTFHIPATLENVQKAAAQIGV